MITTTLNRIRAHHPCREGWGKLLSGLGKTAADDEPLPFARIPKSTGWMTPCGAAVSNLSTTANGGCMPSGAPVRPST